MNVSELTLQGLTCLTNDYKDAEVTGGYTSDLLSDVMANLKAGNVFITIQAHKNSIAVASLTGASAVIFCQGRAVADEVIDAATREGLALFVTPDNQFDTSCAVASALRG